jgi:malate dehydrogenase
LICGFPLSTDGNGVVTIKKGLELSDFAKQKFQVSIDELISERQAVEHLMK